MKQVLQDLKQGTVVTLEVPDPAPTRRHLLVRVQASVISAGTESAQVAKARESVLDKIRRKPELLRRGLEVLRDKGVSGLREQLASKYEGYAELGYSCAGTVIAAGDDTGAIAPGTLVACAGAGVASHAELVLMPPLLTAVAPPGVTPEAAAYATVGAIAMQGIRQAQVQLGEYVAVIGLGLVGLLTAQLLRALGCRVVGVDPSPRARERGRANGCDQVASAEQALDATMTLSGGLGADAIIICAATAESSPVELAGQLARSRGRVVMVGATGMTVPREEYFLKELSFTLSRSYGPGRYDRRYEADGHDYPLDYVRFTEQRNLRAFLELAGSGAIDPARLTTHRFPFDQAPAAYALLNDRSVDRVGIVLNYPVPPEAAAVPARFVIPLAAAPPVGADAVGLGFIGAGAYAQGMLLPLVKKLPGVALRTVMTRNGSHARHAGERFGFATACSRVEDVLNDASVQVVFVTTRHDSHAGLALRALRAGKHVWVEKPLSLTLPDLITLVQALRERPASRLMVGFNRPFSPAARWLHRQFGPPAGPRMMHYRVNAGQVPADSWVNDPAVGGGRLLGEGCHFLDFLRHFSGGTAVSVATQPVGGERVDLPPTGNFAATVQFDNGSVGQVLYSAQGSPRMEKERFECFSGSASGVLLDYKAAEFGQGSRLEKLPRHGQDKGQGALLEEFIRSVRQGEPPPVSVSHLVESTLLTLAAQCSLERRQPVLLEELRRQLP